MLCLRLLGHLKTRLGNEKLHTIEKKQRVRCDDETCFFSSTHLHALAVSVRRVFPYGLDTCKMVNVV
jgi:hypothetical protein